MRSAGCFSPVSTCLFASSLLRHSWPNDFIKLCRALGRFGCTVFITYVTLSILAQAKSGTVEFLFCLSFAVVAVDGFPAHRRCACRQVDALLARGDRAGALRLWSSVVLFEHMPPSTRPGDGPAGFPSMRISVCPKSECPRCDQGRGGFVFPWVGIWNHHGTIVPPGFTPQQAWDRHARLDALMDLLLLQPYRTPYSADNFVPSYLWEFMQKVPGDLDLLPLQTFQSEVLYYMRHWILGSPHGLWSNPFRAPLPDITQLPRHLDALHPKIRAHRALRGWLGSSINGETEFPPACCG